MDEAHGRMKSGIFGQPLKTRRRKSDQISPPHQTPPQPEYVQIYPDPNIPDDAMEIT